MSEEKEAIGEIDIGKTIKSNIDYWRNKCFEQQKEINRLNDENELLKIITRQYNSYCVNTDDDEPRIILAHKDYFNSGMFVSNFISKDKIRAKLDYQYMLWNTPNRQKEYNQEVVDILEELLEEN